LLDSQCLIWIGLQLLLELALPDVVHLKINMINLSYNKLGMKTTSA
jgi:hypothetical protein